MENNCGVLKCGLPSTYKGLPLDELDLWRSVATWRASDVYRGFTFLACDECKAAMEADRRTNHLQWERLRRD